MTFPISDCHTCYHQHAGFDMHCLKSGTGTAFTKSSLIIYYLNLGRDHHCASLWVLCFETSFVAGSSWNCFGEHAAPGLSWSSQDCAACSSYWHFDGTGSWASGGSCFSRLHQLLRWCCLYLFQILLLLGGLSLISASLLGLLWHPGNLPNTFELVKVHLSDPLPFCQLVEIWNCCSSSKVKISLWVSSFCCHYQLTSPRGPSFDLHLWFSVCFCHHWPRSF